MDMTYLEHHLLDVMTLNSLKLQNNPEFKVITICMYWGVKEKYRDTTGIRSAITEHYLSHVLLTVKH